MNQSELTSHVSELRTRLDEIAGYAAGDRQPEAAIASFAAVLFLLRWAEHIDAEQEPADTLESCNYPSALPRDLHWSSWRDLRSGELVDALGGGVLPALRNAPDRGPGKYMKRLVPIVENLVRESPEVIETLLKWGQPFDLETDAGRHAGGNALAALVANATETGEIPGDHTTPNRVAELMAELLDPRPGERVYDPCFGAGGCSPRWPADFARKQRGCPNRFNKACTGWKSVRTRTSSGLRASSWQVWINPDSNSATPWIAPRPEIGSPKDSTASWPCLPGAGARGRRAQPVFRIRQRISRRCFSSTRWDLFVRAVVPSSRFRMALSLGRVPTRGSARNSSPITVWKAWFRFRTGPSFPLRGSK